MQKANLEGVYFVFLLTPCLKIKEAKKYVTDDMIGSIINTFTAILKKQRKGKEGKHSILNTIITIWIGYYF